MERCEFRFIVADTELRSIGRRWPMPGVVALAASALPDPIIGRFGITRWCRGKPARRRDHMNRPKLARRPQANRVNNDF
jgi:hypothetical protein